MATYSRTQTQTQASSSPLMPSVDLGSIIVRSLETSLKEIDNSDSSDLSKTITDGINNSVLGKQNGGPLATSKSKSTNAVALTKEETALQRLRKKNLQDEDKQRKNILRDVAKGYSDLFKNLKSNLEGTFDKTLSALNTFTNNPLEGLDRGIQSIVKGSLGAVDKIMNTKISLPGKNTDAEDKKKLQPVTTLINEKSSQIEDQLKTLIDNNKAGNDKISSNLVQLSNQMKGNERKGEERHKVDVKEGAVKEKKRSQQAENINAGIATTNLTLGTIGQTVVIAGLAIVAGMVLLPIILGKLSEVALRLKEGFTHLMDVTLPSIWNKIVNYVGALVENIKEDFKLMFRPLTVGIQKIIAKLTHWGDQEGYEKAVAEAAGVSEADYQLYKQNEEAAKGYSTFQQLKQQQETELAEYQNLRNQYDALKKKYGVVNDRELSSVILRENEFNPDAQLADRLLTDIQNKRRDMQKTSGMIASRKQQTFELNGKQLTYDDFEKMEDEDLKRAAAVRRALSGNVTQEDYDYLEEKKQANFAKAAEKTTGQTSSLEFEHFLDEALETDLIAALDTGTWFRHFHEGDKYVLTAEQRARVQNNLSKGKFKPITALHSTAAKGQAVADSIGNLVGQAGHDLMISTKQDPYKIKDESQQSVGGSKFNVQQNIGTGSQQVWVNYGNRNLAGK